MCVSSSVFNVDGWGRFQGMNSRGWGQLQRRLCAPQDQCSVLMEGERKAGGEEGVCVFIILSVIKYQSGLSLTWSQHIYHPAIAKYDTFIYKKKIHIHRTFVFLVQATVFLKLIHISSCQRCASWLITFVWGGFLDFCPFSESKTDTTNVAVSTSCQDLLYFARQSILIPRYIQHRMNFNLCKRRRHLRRASQCNGVR